jgi:hypothetical protein
LNATPAQKIWVVVGSGGTSGTNIQYSTNGSVWNTTTQSFGGSGSYGKGVAWNGSIWVAVGKSTTTSNILWSSNGQSWNNTSGGFPAAGAGYGIAWNGSIWVAVGGSSITDGKILWSSNGQTWNTTSGGFTSIGYGIAWNGSIWVAVGSGGSVAANIKWSLDGKTWFNTSGGFTTAGYAIAWNGSIWVAVGLGASSVLWSSDGKAWNAGSGVIFPFNGNGVAWNGSRWVAVGNYGAASGTIVTSIDGKVWSAATGGFTGGVSAGGNGVAWNGSMWIAVGYLGSSTYTSLDGLSWTASTDPFSGNGANGIAYSTTLVPDISTSNLNIYVQSQPTFLTSSHQILATQSTLVLDNTLYIDYTNNSVGINHGQPGGPSGYTLNVNGTIGASGLVSASNGLTVIGTTTTGVVNASGLVTASNGLTVIGTTTTGVVNTSGLVTAPSLALGGLTSVAASAILDVSGGALVRSYLTVGQTTMNTSYAFYVTGSIYATVDVVAGSDKRFKENVVTISNATSMIGQMRGVYFNRIDDDKKLKKVGVIAQEMEQVLPEVVTTDSSDYKFKGVSYANIVAVLIEGMKEQQSTITGQSIQIQTLQNSYGSLLSQVSTLVG